MTDRIYSIYNGAAPDGWYGANFNILQWTTTPPTVEGWYWVYGFRSQYVQGEGMVIIPYLQYVKKEKNRFVIEGDEYDSDIKDGYYWLGPLPVPEPPQEG